MNELESRISSFDSKISNQLGTVDDAASASEAYTVGSYIIHNGVRYIVTAAIAKGDAFNEGTNISKETVNNQIAKLNSAIAEYRLMINPETGRRALAHYTKEA